MALQNWCGRWQETINVLMMALLQIVNDSSIERDCVQSYDVFIHIEALGAYISYKWSLAWCSYIIWALSVFTKEFIHCRVMDPSVYMSPVLYGLIWYEEGQIMNCDSSLHWAVIWLIVYCNISRTSSDHVNPTVDHVIHTVTMWSQCNYWWSCDPTGAHVPPLVIMWSPVVINVSPLRFKVIFWIMIIQGLGGLLPFNMFINAYEVCNISCAVMCLCDWACYEQP